MTTGSRDLTGRITCQLCALEMEQKPVGDTRMLLCSCCGMGRVPEMETSSDYWSTESPHEEEFSNNYWTTARADMFQRALQHFEHRRGAGRIVDFGGGVGFFAECALKRGWDAYSLDISEPAQKVAAERLGPDRSLAPEQAGGLAGSCDVVTLWCVIAHTLDPLTMVNEAVDLLKPGGLLMVTTPNFIFQGTLARLLAQLDKPYDLVCRDHILHFTPGAAGKLLKRAGLESWSFEYLGVTENCFFSPRFGKVLVPLKRVWNTVGTRISSLGLPPLCAELQIVAVKPADSGRSELLPAGT